jgi:hypothetical protein
MLAYGTPVARRRKANCAGGLKRRPGASGGRGDATFALPAGFPHLSPAGENAGAISVFEGGPTRPQAASAVFLGRARGEKRGARSAGREARRNQSSRKLVGTAHSTCLRTRKPTQSVEGWRSLAERGNASNESNPGNEDCYAASRWRVSVWSASSEVGLTSLSVALPEMRRSWTNPRLPTAKNS